jgi:Erv1 / Alr family
MMQFTVNKKNYQMVVPQNNYTQNFQGISFASKVGRNVSPNVIVPNVPEKKDKKSMAWGEPTWFLFHTLAEKVKEEEFPIIRKELLEKIYSICKYLPCPTCADHAVEYLNGINFNAIQKKSDLKLMFFNFHNEINRKKGYPIFFYSDLEDKYSKAVTISMLHYFMSHFEKKTKSIRMIANDFHRSNLVLSLKDWFNNNIQHFDP